jgi:hypothetical protein
VESRGDCYEIVQSSLFHLEHEVDVFPRELGALAVADQLESRAEDLSFNNSISCAGKVTFFNTPTVFMKSLKSNLDFIHDQTKSTNS